MAIELNVLSFDTAAERVTGDTLTIDRSSNRSLPARIKAEKSFANAVSELTEKEYGAPQEGPRPC